MTKTSQVEQLADWKFQYELLTNELFHLQEFTSLIEFDPTFRNESDSYGLFLSQRRLDLRYDEEESGGNIDESNAARRVRRRQKRSRGAADDKQLQELHQRVAEKYKELEERLKEPNGTTKEEHAKMKKTEAEKKRKWRKSETEATFVRAKKEKKRKITLIRSKGREVEQNEQVKNEESTGERLDEALFDGNDAPLELISYTNTDVESEDSFYFTTSDEDDDLSLRDIKTGRQRSRTPKIRLIVKPPSQTVTNPHHVVNPEYGSLRDFLQSYKSLDEDISAEEYNQYIHEQRRTLAAIKDGLNRGVLKYDTETDSIQAIGLKDVQRYQAGKPEPLSVVYKEQDKQTLQDHMLNHGQVMSKIFQDRRRGRISRARKVSQMIEQYFKHVAGAEERKAKEEEKRRRALARAAVQAVKKRWNLAERAYKVLKKDEEEQLKRIKGKEHLSKMLEHSTQLLGAQLNQLDSEGSELESTAYSDGESVDSDDLISTSSSEGEDEKEEDDAKLSVEELRKKYARISELESKDNSKDDASTKSSQDNLDSILDESNSELSSELDNIMTDSGDVSSEDSETASHGLSHLADLFGHIDENLSDSEVQYSGIESSFENSASQTDNTEDEKEVTTTVEPTVEVSPPKPSNDQLSVVDVPTPSLLKGQLRTYQKQGLNWLASLYNNHTNGILADEMGLGKTIQTISLISYLACEKENWGPHLIVVPTSVLLNWEMEFKRFAPGFKVLTYYGSPQQRKEKRKGWNKPDAFHVCITSYQLVVHDQHSFKRKRWEYMILDEAHNIKNFRSTRWQALLNFNTNRRLLLTGTPLQNNIAELWSLLYFLMPQTALANGTISGFADLDAFQQWFGRPVDKMIATDGEHDDETKKTVSKLHQVLRPYLLRRLKADVEKQMPAKYEHIVYCRLSKRQRFLYDDFMSRSQTKATLASGNFMSIINCLMQLRKVCNHPDLFEVRPILTSFCMQKGVASDYSHLNLKILKMLDMGELRNCVDFNTLNLVFSSNDAFITTNCAESTSNLQCVKQFANEAAKLREEATLIYENDEAGLEYQHLESFYRQFTIQKSTHIINQNKHLQYLNKLRCEKRPVYGKNLVKLLELGSRFEESSGSMEELIRPLETRLIRKKQMINEFAILTPNAVVLDNKELLLGINDESPTHPCIKLRLLQELHNMGNPFHQLQTKLSIAFPDKSLLQYDCGKLQSLAVLLAELKENGHRALIFTQMTKVLDILEQFLNYHGYLYLRLDGATKIEDRQILTERFNSDSRITAFILSSRSGGLGINLTGADTVIFYDSDWNPAMDKQCQDRCHRIGQTRDVHIYRFVSEHTIESNILKKANQKRELDNIIIQKGDFTTDYFSKLSVKDLLGAEAPDAPLDGTPLLSEGQDIVGDSKKLEKLLAQAEDEDDVMAAKLAMKEVQVDDGDFREGSFLTEGSPDDDNAGYSEDEYEGTKHIEEYMIRFIANGFIYD